MIGKQGESHGLTAQVTDRSTERGYAIVHEDTGLVSVAGWDWWKELVRRTLGEVFFGSAGHYRGDETLTLAPLLDDLAGALSASGVSSLDASAGAAIKLLEKIKEELNLGSTGPKLDATQVRIASRVTPETLGIAAKIVATDPHQFVAFDAESIGSAAEYVQAMVPVLADAQRLVSDLHASIFTKRLPATEQTLALHATLKGLGRVNPNTPLQTLADELAAKIDRNHKKRGVSGEEQTARRFVKKQAKKIAKQKAKLLEMEQKSLVPASAPQSAPAPAPTPTAEAPGGVTVTVSGSNNAR